MPAHSDDITPLFNAFGGDNAGYREFSRAAGVEEAVSRWPLLQSMAPAARERMAALSEEQRQRRIGDREAVEVAEEVPQLGGRGRKLSDGLNQLNCLKCSEVLRATASVLNSSPENPAEKPAVQPAIAAHGQPPVSSLGAGLSATGLRQERPGHDRLAVGSASANTQFSVAQESPFANSAIHQSAAREKSGIFNKPGNSPFSASGGLFAKKFASPPALSAPPSGRLGELFSRLAGKPAGVVVSNAGRSILGFLGRRAGR